MYQNNVNSQNTIYLIFITFLIISQYLTAYQNEIEDYHFTMVYDETRNLQYFKALEVAIGNKSNVYVLDVGAGSMLLSMMASKIGAAYVIGVEQNTVMQNFATEVLDLNNFTDKNKIQLFKGPFESLKLGSKYLSQPANVFVSETFDSGLIGENFLSILRYAKSSKLLHKDAIIIPNSGSVQCQLLESAHSLSRNNNIFGFNLEPMRKYRRANVLTVNSISRSASTRAILSSVQTAFNFNFQQFDDSQEFQYKFLIFPITTSGVLNSIGLWFHLNLDAEHKFKLTNAPDYSRNIDEQQTLDENIEDSYRSSHWMQYIYRFPSDVFVEAGDIIRVQIVQLTNKYVFGDIHPDSRLIKFVSSCSITMEVYTQKTSPWDLTSYTTNTQNTQTQTHSEAIVDVDGQTKPLDNNIDKKRKEHINQQSQQQSLVGEEIHVGQLPGIPQSQLSSMESFLVLQGYLGQVYRMVAPRSNGKSLVQSYTLTKDGDHVVRNKKKKSKGRTSEKDILPLHIYEVKCPPSE